MPDVGERKDSKATGSPMPVPTNEAQWQTFFNAAPVGVYLVDADLRIRQVNPAAMPVFRRIPNVIGRDLGEVLRIFWPSDRADQFVRQFRRTLETGEPYRVREYVEKRRDSGEVEHYEWQINRIALPDGGYGVVCYFRDISAEAHAREQIAESEERFRSIVNQSFAGIAEVDLNGRFITVNDRYCRNLGYSREELSGLRMQDVTHPDDLASSVERFERLKATGAAFEIEKRYIRKDGTSMWVHNSVSAVRDSTGRLRSILAVSVDITERQAAQAALRASEERYRSLFDSIDEGFCVVEVLFDADDRSYDYRFVEVNPAFERLTGLVDATGKTARALVPTLEQYWFDIYGEVARTGEPRRFENRADALQARWYDVYAFRTGTPSQRRVAILFTDITERKQTEQALKEADRRKDEFLAMLAHELRNPLAPIQNSLGILELTGAVRPGADKTLAILKRQVNNLVRLVDDLIEVSRLSSGKIVLRPELVDVATVVHNAIETSRPLIESARHQLTVTLPPEPLMLQADSLRLSQVIANLLNNAVKYTKPRGHIWLTVRRDAADVVISVRDNGMGIPRDMLPQLFEMFVQLDRDHKRTQGGLGIGLTLVKRLVEMHGGKITASSPGPDQGSEFVVRVPLAASRADDVGTPAARPEQGNPAARKILVVDDNADAAESLGSLLQMMGNEVHVALDGLSALQVIDECRPQFVFLDLGMPGMSGYEVAERIGNDPRYADVTLVALTGWGHDDDRRRTRAAGFDYHLVKPVDMATVEKLLSSAVTRH